MAKFQQQLMANFDQFLNYIHQAILGGSISASYEDGSDWQYDNTRVATRVYERFSYIGGNRLSLSLTLIGVGQQVYITAIASGGSNAVFWKINTWGEEAFLEKFAEAVHSFTGQ